MKTKQIKDASKVDQLKLLNYMKETYKNQLDRWKSITKRLKAFNLVVTILVVSIQIAQVINFLIEHVFLRSLCSKISVLKLVLFLFC